MAGPPGDPLYLGAYGGISPFVRAQERPTFQLGLVTGIYVPLLDFHGERLRARARSPVNDTP